MTTYHSTDEFYAVKLPNLDKEWVEEMNEEMGKVEGSGRVEALFSGFKYLWFEVTKRRVKNKK